MMARVGPEQLRKIEPGEAPLAEYRNGGLLVDAGALSVSVEDANAETPDEEPLDRKSVV